MFLENVEYVYYKVTKECKQTGIFAQEIIASSNNFFFPAHVPVNYFFKKNENNNKKLNCINCSKFYNSVTEKTNVKLNTGLQTKKFLCLLSLSKMSFINLVNMSMKF